MPGAALDVVINGSALERTAVDRSALVAAYESVGFRIVQLKRTDGGAYATSWAKRVAHRVQVLHVTACRAPG
jgi:hypothetical protein